MRIELDEPYRSMYKAGYLNAGTDGRRRVWFTDENGVTVAGTSYARYLMSVKLGYLVPDHLEVDHKDNDFTNDDINNLQLLTEEQNKLKERLNYVENEQACYGFTCAYCTNQFLLTESEVKKRLDTGVEDAFCSRTCASNFHIQISGRSPIGSGISAQDQARIRELRSQGHSSYSISNLTGFARNTVMKHW